MTLPFLHRRVASLIISEEEVVWLEGVRRGRRIRWQRYKREAVTSGDVQEALARLVESLRPANPWVIVHLDTLHVRHFVLVGPPFEEEAFAVWLREEARRHIPPGMSPEDVVVRVQRIDDAEDSTRCLLVLASRQSVDRRRDLLGHVGLRPRALLSKYATVAAIESASPGMDESRVALLFQRSGGAEVWCFERGLLEAISEPPGEPLEKENPLPEVLASLAMVPDECVFVGPDPGARSTCPTRPAAPDPSGYSVDAPPPGALEAALLAMPALVPGLCSVDFLDDHEIDCVQRETDRREALRAAIYVCGVSALLVILVGVFNAYVSSQLHRAGEVLETIAGQEARIADYRAEVSRLENEVAKAERLATERTDASGLLESVGRAVPEGLWLDDFLLEDAAHGTSGVTVTGASVRKEAVAEYLRNLERLNIARDVRLHFTESAASGNLYRPVTADDRRLARFEIHLGVVTFAPLATANEPNGKP